jgi:peptidoglycan/LPS O-acetylase OafA/YrhL
MGRFTSVLFPLFVWLAWMLRHEPRRRRLVLIGCAAAQAIAAALFFSWRPLV